MLNRRRYKAYSRRYFPIQLSIFKQILMKRCAFITLGCKVNQYETQAMREIILKNGYTETQANERADLYVINTCTVTAVSDTKSKQFIKKTARQNPEARILVTGCYAEANSAEIKSFTKGLNITIADRNEKAKIAEFVSSNGSTVPSKEPGSIFDLKISAFEDHTRAFLKIEDGCDNRCSYCIVPFARGDVISRPIDGVIEEAKRLADNGYQEINLTGIHLGAYGKDFAANNKNGANLLNVLVELEKIIGLERIRLSSIEANEISDDMIELIAGSEKICPHFHLPLQSGDDYILKRMNRKYDTNKYLSILDKIRNKIELPAFTTDLIIGFPGENEERFQNSMETCRKAGFSRIHIFPFSAREGTPAAKMPDVCEPAAINARKKIMRATARELAINYARNFIGKDIKILTESTFEESTGALSGYTERYVKTDFIGDKSNMKKFVTVKAKEVADDHLAGVLIN